MERALREFVERFNRGEYWDSHEVLEALWRAESGPLRPFYQGLIQAAAAMVHYERANRRGMLTLAERARARLEPFRPITAGVAVGKLLDDLEACLERDAPPPRIVTVD